MLHKCRVTDHMCSPGLCLRDVKGDKQASYLPCRGLSPPHPSERLLAGHKPLGHSCGLSPGTQ